MNEEQNQAAQLAADNVVVCAPPGSGKTTTLVGAINYDIGRIGHSRNHAIVTYTNSAADELRTRMGGATVYHLGTLHAFCLKLLRRINPSWTLLDEEEAERLVQSIATEMRYRGTKEELTAARRDFWRKERKLTDYSDAERVVLAYAARLKNDNLLEFDTVLERALHAIRHERAKIEPVRFFIDEVQDLADIDWTILQEYPHTKLYTVGDPNQSLYKFRGANPDYMMMATRRVDFAPQFLVRNYRSAARIVGAANALIKHNEQPIQGWAMIGMDETPGTVQAFNCPTQSSHDGKVEQIIDEEFAMAYENPPGKTVAVLCRTNAQVAQISAVMRMDGYIVAENKADRVPDLARVRTLLGIAINPTSTVLQTIAAKQNGGRGIEPPVLPLHYAREALKWLDEWHVPSDAMQDMLKPGRDGIVLKTADLLARLQPFRDPPRQCGIQIGTFHWAKGREFDVVILAFADQKPGALVSAEDRRAWYVGMTRAKRSLYAVGAREREGQWGYQRGLIMHTCVGEANFPVQAL